MIGIGIPRSHNRIGISTSRSTRHPFAMPLAIQTLMMARRSVTDRPEWIGWSLAAPAVAGETCSLPLLSDHVARVETNATQMRRRGRLVTRAVPQPPSATDFAA